VSAHLIEPANRFNGFRGTEPKPLKRLESKATATTDTQLKQGVNERFFQNIASLWQQLSGHDLARNKTFDLCDIGKF